MEKLVRVILPLILIISHFSCLQKEVNIEPEPEIFNGQINESLLPYFEQFEIEAARRGFEVNLEQHGINGTIEEISENFVAGTCTYGTHLPGDVVIDLGFWNNSSAFAKEMVIFHELGHCYLRRDHKETRFSNGTCTSIMRSGNGDCFDNYNPRTREYYIDELFFEEI